MAVFVYKKHPQHNLEGENYPNFRNQADKLAYSKVFIDITKGINVNISRLTFDTAVVILNKSDLPALYNFKNISGIATGDVPTTGEPNLEYWWVNGWNNGATEDVISFNLTLDYWMTYWPLKFNDCLVRVGRRHIDRFFKHNNKFYVNFTSENKQLTIPEANTPPAIQNVPEELDWNPKFNIVTVDYKKTLVLMVGIVIGSIGGFFNTSDQNYLTKLGYNIPGEQNGWIIFGEYNQPAIYEWLSLPGITQTFYFFMNKSFIRNVKLSKKYFDPDTTSSKEYRGKYGVEIIDNVIKFKTRLIIATIDDDYPDGYQGYQKVIYLIASLIGINAFLNFKLTNRLATEEENRFWKAEYLIQVDNDYKINYYFNDTYARSDQLINLKSFFRNNELKLNNNTWKNQTFRSYKNVYFTSLKAFNTYMSNVTGVTLANFQLNLPISKTFTIYDVFDPVYELKMYTINKYYYGWLNETQEIPVLLYNNKHGIVAKEPIELSFFQRFYVSLTNNYFYVNFNTGSYNLENKKYNFVAKNISRLPNYTDQSIQFYQQQGISFETGINQAKYQLDWVRRYQQFANTSFKYRQITGGIKGFVSDIAGAVGAVAGIKKGGGDVGGAGAGALAFGVMGDIADRAVNTYFNFQEFGLNQELQRKNSIYSVKSMLARQDDIFNQPTTTNVENSNELYMLMKKPLIENIDPLKVDFPKSMKPYMMVLTPTYADWKRVALMYHKNGNVADQLEKVDFNSENTRYYWNFWEIHNIEQAIVKDNLNSMVINYFNKKFNDGVRLWNVYRNVLLFNTYTLANWEIKVVNPIENENQ